MYFMSDPQALHVTRNVIPGKLGVDLHLHRVHIPLVLNIMILEEDRCFIACQHAMHAERDTVMANPSVCLSVCMTNAGIASERNHMLQNILTV